MHRLALVISTAAAFAPAPRISRPLSRGGAPVPVATARAQPTMAVKLPGAEFDGFDGAGIRHQPLPHDDRRRPALLRQGGLRRLEVGAARVLPRLRLVVPSLGSGEREDLGPV